MYRNGTTRAAVIAGSCLALALTACGGGSSDADASAPRDAPVDRASEVGASDAGADASADVETRNGCPVLRDPVAARGDPAMGDTWADFARPLFARVCTRCHSSSRTDPTARNGAPDGFDWDLEASVRAQLARIRGAVGIENYMPIGDPGLSCAERRRVVRWIDLGAP